MVLFSEWKGYKIYKNIFYQCNKSEIMLEVNGKISACKIIRELGICYFFITYPFVK